MLQDLTQSQLLPHLMAHMDRSSLARLFHRHALGIDGDRGAGPFLRKRLASAADLFDQRFDRYIGREGMNFVPASWPAAGEPDPANAPEEPGPESRASR